MAPALVMAALVSVLGLVLIACGGQASAHSSPAAPVVYKATPPRQGAWSFVSRPDLHPARLTVTTDSPQAAPGYVFVTPGSAKYGETGPLIVDAHGNPVWVGTVPAGQNATNLRVQQYQGKPVLTWWQGKIVMPGYGQGADVIVNSKYQVVTTVHAGNGLSADVHDFTITPQGDALITAYKVVPYDLSALGGSKKGKLLDSLVQLIDISTGKVLFQWDPLKHIPLTDSYMRPVKGQLYDPYHLNSATLYGSGRLLVSVRHTWGVYAIDMKTGGVIWRMGGKHSDFTFGPGVSFAWQHAAFPLSAGQMVLFDNEAAGTAKHAPLSAALVLQVDEASRTVTLIHKFTQPGLLASSQGDVQALPNGDYFVGWGAMPYANEYAPTGRQVWEAHFYKTDQSYRAFKAPWTGLPVLPPDVKAVPDGGGVSVSMSWNGATGVASWQILAGKTKSSLKVVATTPRTGFETTVTVKHAAFYEVRPLAADGRPLSSSAVVGVSAPASASPSPAPSPALSPALSPSASPVSPSSSPSGAP